MAGIKSPKTGAIIVAIIVIITQIVLRAFEANKIVNVITAIFLMVVGVAFAVKLIKYGNKGLGRRLNIAASIFLLVASILAGPTLIMISCYPQFGDTHKILSMILNFSALGSILAVFTFIIVAGCIFLKNNK